MIPSHLLFKTKTATIAFTLYDCTVGFVSDMSYSSKKQFTN